MIHSSIEQIHFSVQLSFQSIENCFSKTAVEQQKKFFLAKFFLLLNWKLSKSSKSFQSSKSLLWI